MNHREITK